MLLTTILKDEMRLLTFRAPGAGIREHPGGYLAFGLVMTWAAGVGRYWDSPQAALWQHLGLASLGYVFLLALIIWLIVAPLDPRNWSYRNVLLFVTLTSPPALLYAIPVEVMFSYNVAHTINTAFLAIVAVWRVAFLIVFLTRAAGLKGSTILVAALLPLVLIVNGLTLFGVEHTVYANMVGDHDPNGPGKEGAHAFLSLLCLVSAVLGPALLVLHAWIARRVRAGSNSIGVSRPDGQVVRSAITT